MSTPVDNVRPRLLDLDGGSEDPVAALANDIPQKLATPVQLLFSEQQPLFTPVSTNDEDEEPDDNDDGAVDIEVDVDDKEGRLRRDREEEESIELARRLMAEEAMASYQQHFQLLRESAADLAQEDYEALQAALEEEAHQEVAELEDDNGDLSYDTMLELGERIGDVKSERWAMVAAKEVTKLPTFLYDPQSTTTNTQAGTMDSNTESIIAVKCMVCQCEFEAKEELRRMPCNHYFHVACVDQWLKDKDSCPYCRKCIVERE